MSANEIKLFVLSFLLLFLIRWPKNVQREPRVIKVNNDKKLIYVLELEDREGAVKNKLTFKFIPSHAV